MHAFCRFALLAFFAMSANSFAVPVEPAAPNDPKKTDEPNIVEVRLADGSAVRMTLVQTHIDVQTRYGKLSVPVAEIKRIDFGFRYPDGVKEKIEDAIAKLGSPHFKVREAAAADLYGYKELSYPALKGVLKSQDAEVVKRADELIKKLEDKLPADRLKIGDNDQIHTFEFTIAGRIESPVLKARSPYFGEVQVQLAEARNLRSLRSVGIFELNVEARFSNQNEWLETEVDLTADDPIEVKAGGQMLLRQGGAGFESTPDGNTNYQNGNYIPGQLLGRVGRTGKTFVVGEKYRGSPGESGRLYLHVHPSPWGNQMTGSYSVKVTVANGVEGRMPKPTKTTPKFEVKIERK
jgi:hypothetical protein